MPRRYGESLSSWSGQVLQAGKFGTIDGMLTITRAQSSKLSAYDALVSELYVTLNRNASHDRQSNASHSAVALKVLISMTARMFSGCLHQYHAGRPLMLCLPGHCQQVLVSLRRWRDPSKSAFACSKASRGVTTHATLSSISPDTESIAGAGIIKAQVQCKTAVVNPVRDCRVALSDSVYSVAAQ